MERIESSVHYHTASLKTLLSEETVKHVQEDFSYRLRVLLEHSLFCAKLGSIHLNIKEEAGGFHVFHHVNVVMSSRDGAHCYGSLCFCRQDSVIGNP